MRRVSRPVPAEMVWRRLTGCARRGAATLRMAPHGGELVPLVFEAGGRPAEETVAWVRSWGLEMYDADRSKVIRYAWQQYSNVLQSGNAEMILSAVG